MRDNRTTPTRLAAAVLPAALPSSPGWELAHHYSPAGRTEVGGDFYDALELADGRLVVFIGDVMGRGVAAAASMAQVRAAVRAYAALDPSPARVLRRLDRPHVVELPGTPADAALAAPGAP